MLRRYWEILRPFHRVFYTFLAIITLYEAAQIAEGYVISLVILLTNLHVEILGWVALIIGLLIFDELFMRLDNYLDWHIISKLSYPLSRFFKTKSIAKFLEMDISWHQKHNSGALAEKVASGTIKVNDILDGLSWEFIPTMIQLLLSLIPIFIFSLPTGIISVISFSLFLWVSIKDNKTREPLRKKRYDIYEEAGHKGLETVQSFETVHIFNQESRFQDEQDEMQNDIVRLGTREAKTHVYTYNRLRIRILTIARRLILIFWIYQLFTGDLSIANLIFVNVLSEKLFSSVWRFARLMQRVSESSEGARRLLNLLGEKPAFEDVGLDPDIPSSISIEMKEVCFGYDGYTREVGALHDLNLTIPGGSIIGLVGPSGAGKSTIRKIIAGLIPIQSGEITVGGVNIEEWKPSSLRRLFSYVPQGDLVHIYDRSIRWNIGFPRRPDPTLDEIKHAAELAGIHDFIMKLPGQYETIVGEKGQRLSGGEKQRIAIARAIIADRPILILDEATSSVDAITERIIQDRIHEILNGKTAIIIAHRLSTIWNVADRIVVMDDGKKVEEGTHEELVRLGGLYAKMVALQES